MGAIDAVAIGLHFSQEQSMTAVMFFIVVVTYLTHLRMVVRVWNKKLLQPEPTSKTKTKTKTKTEPKSKVQRAR